MEKSKVLELAEKNLSNNFKGKGEKKMDTLLATANSFGVNITNGGTNPVNIALIPGHYPILGLDTSGATPLVHYHELVELTKAGIAVGAILDDGDQPITGGTLTCLPIDPAFTIRSFMEYIKSYDMIVSRLDIRSDTGNVAVYQNKLKISKTNPFNRTEEVPIKTGQFFSINQYQDNRIEINMLGTGLTISKDLMMILTIPANATVGVDLYFAN